MYQLDDLVPVLQMFEFIVEIYNLDPTQPIVIPISPDQEYHLDQRFQALFSYLDSQGVHVIFVVADELRRFNFMVEEGIEDELHPVIQFKVNQLKESWPAVNLKMTSHTNKVTVLDWKTCKEKFKPWFEESTRRLDTLFAEKGEYYDVVVKTATIFFKKFMERTHHKNNTVIQNFINKNGEDFVVGLFIKYVKEECAMMGAWQLAGLTQMAYPFEYHRGASDPENTNQGLQNCVASALHHLNTNSLRLLDIRYLSKTEIARKRSLDAQTNPKAQSQEQRFILELKLKIRKLQEEKQQLITELNKKTQEKPQETEKNLWNDQLSTLIDKIQHLNLRTAQLEEELKQQVKEQNHQLEELRGDFRHAVQLLNHYQYTTRQLRGQLPQRREQPFPLNHPQPAFSAQSNPKTGKRFLEEGNYDDFEPNKRMSPSPSPQGSHENIAFGSNDDFTRGRLDSHEAFTPFGEVRPLSRQTAPTLTSFNFFSEGRTYINEVPRSLSEPPISSTEKYRMVVATSLKQ